MSTLSNQTHANVDAASIQQQQYAGADRIVNPASASFVTEPSFAPEGQGHTVASEGHLPAAQIATHDVTNPSNADANMITPGMTDPSKLDSANAHNASRSAALDSNHAVMSAFPAPTKGEDAKLESHLRLVGADLKVQGTQIGKEIAAGLKTAPAQFKDTWSKLSAKASEMKQQHFGNKKVEEQKQEPIH